MIIFPDLPEILIEQTHVADEITLALRTTSPSASCLNCGTLSMRVQSRYRRTLHDLPSTGRPVHLIVHVRRFFCKKSTCTQKIFTEQLPELCHPHAQRTIRLQDALGQLGLVLGGQAGARVGSDLGISGSRDTILRMVRQHPLPSTRQRERTMRRFQSPGHAQRFLSAFGLISDRFRLKRHYLSAPDYRVLMQRRFQVWNEVTAGKAAA
ncbi:transposase family protein [Ktedonobacter sp. SOSP1-52]|uniref:transposase family protein n=1 Tax=Ktedonobacter sp. SOSP1-52 TaxID=2778366 RepID=UPI001916C405|nr:transposase family protein [Ktedonobacter sp. SOSP1-52]